MFSSMKVRLAILTATVFLTLAPLGVGGQPNLAALNQQLEQSVSRQNWGQAIGIIDRMLRIAPDQAGQLKAYRARLQKLHQTGYRGSARPSSLPPSQSAVLPTGQVPIKRRQNGIAIIDVNFNGRTSFEMMVDSGASMTIITRPMAKALGITPDQVVDRLTFATANGYTKMPIVYVKSIEIGGLQRSQLRVGVGGPDMKLGLLGQDFLKQYDVSLMRDRIVFRQPQ